LLDIYRKSYSLTVAGQEKKRQEKDVEEKKEPDALSSSDSFLFEI